MSSAVRAEYDRQRENVGKFRRSALSGAEDAGEGGGGGASSARSAAVAGQKGPVVSYARDVFRRICFPPGVPIL